MVIIRYFLSDTYIAKSQLSSVNCQPKATAAKTSPQFTHRQTISFPVANYQFLGGKLPSSLSRTPAAMSANHKYTLQNGNQSMHSRILHRQSANQS